MEAYKDGFLLTQVVLDPFPENQSGNHFYFCSKKVVMSLLGRDRIKPHPSLGVSVWDVFSRRGQQFPTMPRGREYQVLKASSELVSILGHFSANFLIRS